jgi:hypothetical protein
MDQQLATKVIVIKNFHYPGLWRNRSSYKAIAAGWDPFCGLLNRFPQRVLMGKRTTLTYDLVISPIVSFGWRSCWDKADASPPRVFFYLQLKVKQGCDAKEQ